MFLTLPFGKNALPPPGSQLLEGGFLLLHAGESSQTGPHKGTCPNPGPPGTEWAPPSTAGIQPTGPLVPTKPSPHLPFQYRGARPAPMCHSVASTQSGRKSLMEVPAGTSCALNLTSALTLIPRIAWQRRKLISVGLTPVQVHKANQWQSSSEPRLLNPKLNLSSSPADGDGNPQDEL